MHIIFETSVDQLIQSFPALFGRRKASAARSSVARLGWHPLGVKRNAGCLRQVSQKILVFFSMLRKNKKKGKAAGKGKGGKGKGGKGGKGKSGKGKGQGNLGSCKYIASGYAATPRRSSSPSNDSQKAVLAVDWSEDVTKEERCQRPK